MIGTSRVASGATVGPYARLRLENDVAAGAQIGNFVELEENAHGRGR